MPEPDNFQTEQTLLMNKPARGRPNLRNHLIQVACELLRAQGPSALTARAVARRAGVAEATVFNNFGDLRGLLIAISREGFPEYDALIACIDRGPGTRVADWLAEVFELNRRYMLAALPLSMQQLVTLAPQKSPAPKSPENRLVTFTHRTLCERLESLRAAGQIRQDADIPAAAMLLVAGGAHAALAEFTTGIKSVLSENPDELARRLVGQLGLV